MAHKFFRLAIVAALLASLASCRTLRVVEQVPVPVHDTVYQKTVHHDSIYIDRFREVTKKNDTIYITDQVTKTKIVTKTDTAYRYIDRPVTGTRTETVEVKNPLRWWQNGLMWTGAIGILAALTAVVVRLRRR